jgi:hypothetical protein
VKSCFFISRIGNRGSDERTHSDKLLEHIVCPVVQQLGYDSPKRSDHLTTPGTITTQVYERLWKSDLVVADLTGSNPNVFYELAVRHLSKRPFVHMLLRGETLPFDLAPERVVLFDFDIATNAEVRRELSEHIESAENTPGGCRTALSDAVGTAELLATLKGPFTTEITVIETVVSMLQDIQSAVKGAATIRTSFGLPSLPNAAFPEGTVLFDRASRKFYVNDSGYKWSGLADAVHLR